MSQYLFAGLVNGNISIYTKAEGNVVISFDSFLRNSHVSILTEGVSHSCFPKILCKTAVLRLLYILVLVKRLFFLFWSTVESFIFFPLFPYDTYENWFALLSLKPKVFSVTTVQKFVVRESILYFTQHNANSTWLPRISVCERQKLPLSGDSCISHLNWQLHFYCSDRSLFYVCGSCSLQ